MRIGKADEGETQKGKKVKQRSTKHYTENKRACNTNSTKNREWTQLPRMGSSSRSTRGTRRVTLVTNQVMSHEWSVSRIYNYST
jgi:hypothetical protein